MNWARVAGLLRELADELERGDPANDDAPPAAPAKRRPARVALLPGPVNPPSDIDRARARDAARRLGHLVRG